MRFREHVRRRRSALGPDRGQEHEALGARLLGGAGEPDRRLGVQHPVVVLRHARHRVRDAGRVDHRIDAGERRRHVLRPGEIADDGAGRLRRQGGRAPQEHADAIAALRQLAQEMAADEAGGAGQRDERAGHAGSLRPPGAAKRARTSATRTPPAASARELRRNAAPHERRAGKTREGDVHGKDMRRDPHDREPAVGRLLVEVRPVRLPDPLPPHEAPEKRDRRIGQIVERQQQRRREAAVERQAVQHPGDEKPDRQRADVAEEEPRHRPVERRKSDERPEQRRRDDRHILAGKAERAEQHERGRDRRHLGDGDPIDPVHEVHEVHEPDPGDDRQSALEPKRHDARQQPAGAARSEHHDADRERLQHETQEPERADGCRRPLRPPRARASSRQRAPRLPRPAETPAAASAALATASVAAITAMPPPCGVGTVWLDRAFGRASA